MYKSPSSNEKVLKRKYENLVTHKAISYISNKKHLELPTVQFIQSVIDNISSRLPIMTTNLHKFTGFPTAGKLFRLVEQKLKGP
jgi:hypothetical protein